MRILLIEDRKPLVKVLQRGLEEQGFAVDTAADGEEGDSKARSTSYDVIVLDLWLPKKDGLTLLRDWQRHGLCTHVLVLTALSAQGDPGHDWNRIPYDPAKPLELMARLCDFIRRGPRVKETVIRVFDLEIDTDARTVQRAGQLIELRPREYELLELLAAHRGQIVSRALIWEKLYDEFDANTSNVVDVHIRHLRVRIDKGFTPPLILTRYGQGYFLRTEEHDD